MHIAGTGHRPDKLGGYTERVERRLHGLAVACVFEHRPDRIISGMAQGWDTALAEAAVRMRVPFTAAIPFWGQDLLWPAKAQRRYQKLLDLADRVHVVVDTDSGDPVLNPWFAFQARNEWMVDHCDLVLALWDGSKGGTGNCVSYAKKIGVPICNVWESYPAKMSFAV